MNKWLWFQAASFQVIWLSAVLGGNQWIALSIVILCTNFVFTPSRADDLKVLPIAFIGIAIDAVFTTLGVFEFEQFPAWLIILWLGFVLNFGHSLKVIHKIKLYWQIIIGALGGCYAYIVSWKLGAVEFPLGGIMTACLLAVAWAISFPLFMRADRYLRAFRHE
jgi:hypothetical protein